MHVQSQPHRLPGLSSAQPQPHPAILSPHRRVRCHIQQPCVAPDNEPSTSGRVKGNPERQTGLGLKAVWYAAEAFGKAVGGRIAASDAPPQQDSPQMDRDAIVASIREDYQCNYFVSGAGDMAAYAADCVFADPFVSFQGTQRFKQNVGNLGGLMRDVKLDVYSFKDLSPEALETRWRFSCILDLPWRPLLAAAGSTVHVLDLQQGRVVKHIENWDIEPGKVVAQLFRPAAKVPQNAWETFLMSAWQRDVGGMWMASTPGVSRLSLGVAGSLWATQLLTSQVQPHLSAGLGQGAAVSSVVLLAAAGTELIKVVKSLAGGESG